jgi:hypothetical protein
VLSEGSVSEKDAYSRHWCAQPPYVVEKLPIHEFAVRTHLQGAFGEGIDVKGPVKKCDRVCSLPPSKVVISRRVRAPYLII